VVLAMPTQLVGDKLYKKPHGAESQGGSDYRVDVTASPRPQEAADLATTFKTGHGDRPWAVSL